tara:strand:+ start:21 stop:239 length:219 start_codon:yes stop_codon:yes gene_type:complete
MSLRDNLNKELKSLNTSKYIKKKPKVPEIDLDELNELLKEPTNKAREIFKNNFKKGGLVIKGKPKLAKKGWR